jgi:hypothetical protein
MGIEALTGGLVEGLHRTSANGNDQHMPDPDDIEERQGRQHEDETGGKALSDDNQAALVESVGKNPTKEIETNGRHTIGESHIAQGQGRTGELVDQPELTEA